LQTKRLYRNAGPAALFKFRCVYPDFFYSGTSVYFYLCKFQICK
jgi:hypothetical protein